MDPDSSYQIPARVYFDQLSGGGPAPRFQGGNYQRGYGAFGDFFGSLARTARNVIFPNLVRLGKSVVEDVFTNNLPLLDSARARTREAVENIATAVQRGEGRKRRRRRGAKKTSKTGSVKKAKRSVKRKKAVSKKRRTSRKKKSYSVSLQNLLRRT